MKDIERVITDICDMILNNENLPQVMNLYCNPEDSDKANEFIEEFEKHYETITFNVVETIYLVKGKMYILPAKDNGSIRFFDIEGEE